MATASKTQGANGRIKAAVVTELATNATENVEFFYETVTLNSAVATTPVNIIPDARVGEGRRVFLMGGVASVNGATAWGGGTTAVAIEGTDGTDFVVFAGTIGTTLAANQARFFTTDNVDNTGNTARTLAAFDLGSGGTPGRGLQVVGDATGNGSPLVVTVWGIIR